MTGCIGLTAKGDLCRGIAKHGSDYCAAHDPARKEARRRSASKAARSKGNGASREISSLKTELQRLAEDVLACEVETKVAAVATQIYNARIKLVEVERRVRESEELEAKIEAIEDALGRSGEGAV